MTMKTWTFAETHPKMPGPWSDEPDKAQWIDEKTNLDCLVVRNRLGALCGYVGVPPEHPLHGEDYDTPAVEVHGGLTYADRCVEGAEDAPRICHIPEPGRPADVWWFGFDCAHAWDLIPGMRETYAMADIMRVDTSEVYRTFTYVQQEIAQLAQQLAASGIRESETAR